MAEAMKDSQLSINPGINDAIENVNSVNSNMKITDLNIDCLEEIFYHLGASELLNVADTNTRFRKAACIAFIRRNKDGTVVTRNNEVLFGLPDIDEQMNSVTAFRILRCFGQLITDLCIFFVKSDQILCTEIIRYLNEYCAQNLVTLSIDTSDYIYIDNIFKVFPKVRSILFFGFTLGKNLTNFNKWFPQMHDLFLNGINIQDPKSFEMNFPQLRIVKHYQYDNVFSKQSFNDKNVKEFIRWNPQLRHFTCDHFNISLIQHLSKHLHELDELELSAEDLTHGKYYHISPIRFKYVKQLTLKLNQNYSFPVKAITFNKLEEFVAIGMEFTNFQYFVKKYKIISKLTINANDLNYTVENIMKIVKTLPLLSMLTLVKLQNDLSIDDAVRFMVELKQLKRFAFAMNHTFEVSHLEEILGNEWRVILNDNKMINLERNVDFNQ